MKSFCALFTSVAFLLSAQVLFSQDEEAPPASDRGPTFEVVSASGVSLDQDGVTTTVSAGDVLTEEQLEDLGFADGAELVIKNTVTGQVIRLLSPEAIATYLLSTQSTLNQSPGQIEEPNPQPMPDPEPTDPEPKPEVTAEEVLGVEESAPVTEPSKTAGPVSGATP